MEGKRGREGYHAAQVMVRDRVQASQRATRARKGMGADKEAKDIDYTEPSRDSSLEGTVL